MSSTGTDMISELADDLASRVAALQDVKDGAVYLYDLEDVLYERKKLRYPAVTLLYNNMTASSSDRTGRSADAVFDFIIIAERDRQDRVDRLGKQVGTGILTDIRRTILGDQQCQNAPTGKPWEFVLERPVDVEKHLMTYLQRWKTRVITFC